MVTRVYLHTVDGMCGEDIERVKDHNAVVLLACSKQVRSVLLGAGVAGVVRMVVVMIVRRALRERVHVGALGESEASRTAERALGEGESRHAALGESKTTRTAHRALFKLLAFLLHHRVVIIVAHFALGERESAHSSFGKRKAIEAALGESKPRHAALRHVVVGERLVEMESFTCTLPVQQLTTAATTATRIRTSFIVGVIAAK